MKLSNRLKIILLATIFNLSFEFAFRGFNFLNRPFLVIYLFGMYFTLYLMLEDLIVRFKINNLQLVLSTLLYGIFPMAFGTGLLFKQPQFLGINWVNLFFIGFLWWGILQAILTFYLATRIVKRDWSHPRLGKMGWLAAIGYNLLALRVSKRINPYLPPVQPTAYLIFCLIVLGIGVFLWQSIQKNRKQETWVCEKSIVLDFLSFGSLVLFLFLGIFITGDGKTDPISLSHLNPLTVRIVNLWTIIYSIIFLVYRFLVRKKEITA